MTNSKRIVGAVLLALGLGAGAACSGGNGQSMECGQYLGCVVKFSGTSASLDSKYGTNGTCWTDSAQAEVCSKFCRTALAAFPGDAGC